MDVREKLVELILDAGNDKNLGWYDLYDLTHKRTGCAEYFADYLIANSVTVQEFGGCEYCNGLPFSQMEDFTMPNASKKDYDIVTIRFCPMCGRRLPQPPKGE